MTTTSDIRPIPSCPGYFASSGGRVYSKSGWRGLAWREMLPSMSGGKRYPVVRVMVDGKRTTRNVHRLVAEAFHGPCPDGMECRHLDGDATNNAADNLRWGTHVENCADRVAHGTGTRGERVNTAKLTERRVREIRDRVASETSASIARRYGVTDSAILAIRKGKSWKHVA